MRKALFLAVLCCAGVVAPSQTWRKIDSWEYSAHRIAFRAGALYAGYWGFGVWQYDGVTWRRVGLDGLNVEEVTLPGNNGLRVGVDCEGVFDYRGGVFIPSGLTCAERLLDYGARWYCVTAWSFAVSRDSGRTWATIMQLGDSAERGWSICADSSGHMFLGALHHIYRYTPLTARIENVYYSAANTDVWDLLYDLRTNTLYAATGFRGLMTSRNGGDTWATAGFSGVPLHALCLAAFDHLLYVGAGERLVPSGSMEGVYRGAGSGPWEDLKLRGLSVQSITCDLSGNVFVGVADHGVWEYSPPLPCDTVFRHDTLYIDTLYILRTLTRWLHDTLRVRDTALVHDTAFVHDTVSTVRVDTLVLRDTVTLLDTLRLVVRRDTLWRNTDTVNFSTPGACDTFQIDVRPGITVRLYPNPASRRVTLDVSADSVITFQMELYDVAGRRLTALLRTLPVGVTRSEFPVTLAAGTYFLRIAMRTWRVVVVR